MVGDIESVKTELAAVLANTATAIDRFGATKYFNDALDTVNAEKNDGHVTPYPASIYPYERAVIESYPAVELQGLVTTYQPEDDVKAGTQRVAVVWTVVGDNEASVTTDVERLVRATRDVLWRSLLSADLGLAPIHVESEDYSALAPGGPNPFMKGGRVVLVIDGFAN